MKNYKIIRKNQFACSVMQVRRDGKMPVALLKEFDEAIISQAYPVFQVIDETELLPEYLMMWFTRSEFDRQATFHAVGGVRGSLEWEDFLDFELPIPSIEKQQQIVAEYNTVTNRIQLNEKINNNLEATAQALYKHWFVDFEFPNAENKPYKSSGGDMVYNEELDKDIPVGWSVEKVNDLSNVLFGYPLKSKSFSSDFTLNPLIRIRDILSNKSETFTNQEIEEKYTVIQGDLLIGMDGKFHTSIWMGENSLLNQRVARIREEDNVSIYKILFSIKEEIVHLEDSIFGTTVGHLSNSDVRNLKVLKSTFENSYKLKVKPILSLQFHLLGQSQKLQELQSLLLAKMTKIEVEKEMV